MYNNTNNNLPRYIYLFSLTRRYIISIYVFKFFVIQFMKLVTLVYTPGY